jgi:hypothetical protein
MERCAERRPTSTLGTDLELQVELLADLVDPPLKPLDVDSHLLRRYLEPHDAT